MPFSETDSLAEEKWTEIFNHIIKPAVEESGLGYECKRYSLGRANIVKDILEELNTAQVVMADLTDDNPNVLWELGVRHTLKRRTILISQEKKFIPSDLKDYPVIPYDQTKAGFDKFKEAIKQKLEDIEANPEKSDSPASDFLEHKNVDILAYEKSANLKKLSALVSELSYNIKSTDSILNTVEQNEQVRKTGKGSLVVSNQRFSSICLDLLLSTSYIMLSQEWLKAIKGIHNSIKMWNSMLESWKDKTFVDYVEKKTKDVLPEFKDILIDFTKCISTLRTEYASDNYQEPKVPVILLASPEHEEYLKLTEQAT